MPQIQGYFQELLNLVSAYSKKAILALILLILGLWLIKKLAKGLKRFMNFREVDPGIQPFLISLTVVVLRIMLIISVATTLGIKMTSFIAMLGAAGLAIGLALQGSLSNLAGGVLILLLKPFRVGHYIDFKGTTGTVKDINLFYTHIVTDTNQVLVVPNGDLANSSIKNFSINDRRKMDVSFRFGLQNDTKKAKVLINEIFATEPGLLTDPTIKIYVGELTETYFAIRVEAWFKNADYWPFYNTLFERVKSKLDENKMMPPPSMHLTIKNDGNPD